jgi:D-serine deaminase-like pyridoxal phosphate-dependent protein
MQQSLQDLDTPALIVDLDIMERNLQKYHSYCKQHGLQLWPHTKTHKTPELAKLQMKYGAPGVTCAKIGEAEVMAAAGIPRILLAFPIVGPQKMQRLIALARKVELTVALDSFEAAQPISDAAQKAGLKINVLLEFNVGLDRVGVETPEEVVSVGRKITTLPGVNLVGLTCYPGYIWVRPEQMEVEMRKVDEKVHARVEAARKAGLPTGRVSGGSTPTAMWSHLVRDFTEIRPGQYIFNDFNEVCIGIATIETCALRVLATVVSTAVTNRVIIDGGSKTFSSDRLHTPPEGVRPGFGYIVEYPDLWFEKYSEEHGHINTSFSAKKPHVGERVTVIPNHVCPCVNMHDTMYGIRNGKVEAVWKIAARGKVQ